MIITKIYYYLRYQNQELNFKTNFLVYKIRQIINRKKRPINVINSIFEYLNNRKNNFCLYYIL